MRSEESLLKELKALDYLFVAIVTFLVVFIGAEIFFSIEHSKEIKGAFEENKVLYCEYGNTGKYTLVSKGTGWKYSNSGIAFMRSDRNGFVYISDCELANGQQ